MRRKTQIAPVLALFASVLVASCGGNDGDGGPTTGGSSAPASADVLLTDAPIDDLLSFSATVDSLSLVRGDGTESTNLLEGPVRFEFLGLQDAFAWVATDQIQTGTYAAVRVGFVPFSYEARRKDGTSVDVNAFADELLAPLETPLQVGFGSYTRFVADLDLAESLEGDVAAGFVDFDPTGITSADDGSQQVEVDELRGVLFSADEAQGRLVVDAFVDEDLVVELGRIEVEVGPNVLLVDEDGSTFPAPADFYEDLIPGATALEVHGQLIDDGILRATKIEVEDSSAGSDSASVVKIEGIVTELETADSIFRLLIAEVEKGELVALPVLLDLEEPIATSVEVEYDEDTFFFQGDDQLASSDQLMVGQRVKVKFDQFVSEPFRAFKVELIDEDAEYEGVIADVSGLPDEIVVRLDDGEPAILAGLVEDEFTDVVVDLSQSAIRLDTAGEPALSAGSLLVGLEVDLRGLLGGTKTEPTITANDVEVEAGKLDGAVVFQTYPGAAFGVQGGSLDEPFGESVSPFGSKLVYVDPTAVIEGDATSVAEIYTLFASLGAGQQLELDVEGIGTGIPSEIRALEIDVQVVD